MQIDIVLDNESVVQIIKNWKTPKMYSKDADGEFLLFEKSGLDFRMHTALQNYLDQTNQFNEIAEFLALKTEINRIVLFDDSGDKIGLRLRKPE